MARVATACACAVLLTALPDTAPPANGAAPWTGTPTGRAVTASLTSGLPSPAQRTAPDSGGAHRSRGGARRLSDASLDVLRLGAAARRTRQAYADGRRDLRAQRAERDRLRTALRRDRRRADDLRRAVGALAAEQYRAGSAVAYTLRAAGGRDGKRPVRADRPPGNQERSLAARVRAVRRETRALAAADAAATARAAALSSRRDALDQARERAGRGLRTARAELGELAAEASGKPSCARIPRAVSTAAEASAPASGTRARWTRPVVRYELSAPFGGSGDHWANSHTGQDFAVPVGTPVRSVGAGRIISLTCGDGFGISMVVRHGKGLYSQYAHLSAALVRPGRKVAAGDRIALSGDTGNSTGPHLHFEVRRTPALGSGVDPVPWLREHGVRV